MPTQMPQVPAPTCANPRESPQKACSEYPRPPVPAYWTLVLSR